MNRPRYPKLVKDANGKPVCRGCGAPVPPGRKTWCSSECYRTRCPNAVKIEVNKRDKGICQICGRDTFEMRKHRDELRWKDRYAFSEFQAVLRKLGFRWSGKLHDYDHIIPHSEGGEFVLENIRTLCTPCHKRETAKLRSRKSDYKNRSLQSHMNL